MHTIGKTSVFGFKEAGLKLDVTTWSRGLCNQSNPGARNTKGAGGEVKGAGSKGGKCERSKEQGLPLTEAHFSPTYPIRSSLMHRFKQLLCQCHLLKWKMNRTLKISRFTFIFSDTVRRIIIFCAGHQVLSKEIMSWPKTSSPKT